MMRIVDVEAVVIERGQCAHHTAHHRHWVRVTAEAAEEVMNLLIHHRVIGDTVIKIC